MHVCINTYIRTHTHTHTHTVCVYIYIYTARTKCRVSHLKADVSVHSFFKIGLSFVAVLFKVSIASFWHEGRAQRLLGEYKKK